MTFVWGKSLLPKHTQMIHNHTCRSIIWEFIFYDLSFMIYNKYAWRLVCTDIIHHLSFDLLIRDYPIFNILATGIQQSFFWSIGIIYLNLATLALSDLQGDDIWRPVYFIIHIHYSHGGKSHLSIYPRRRYFLLSIECCVLCMRRHC